MKFFVVLSTAPDKKSALNIARVLVQKKLAACVSFREGWRSVYPWKGKIRISSEVLILAKTSSKKIQALQQAMIKIHPYAIPEILALPVSGGFSGYLGWLKDSLK